MSIRTFLRIVVTLLACIPLAGTVIGGDEEFDVQGHRGWAARFPENSLPAFEKAIELGVTTLEMDVHMTRDGVIVVHHDPRPDRALCIRDDGGRVPNRPFVELNYADLIDIDCGRRTPKGNDEYEWTRGARIPRLDDVLVLAGGASYPVRVSIEVKRKPERDTSPVDRIVPRLLEVLRRSEFESRAMIQSFDPEVLVAVRSLSPELPRSLLVRGRGYQAWIEDGTATVVSPKKGSLKRSDVTELQGRGIGVIPWTVNEPGEIRKMIDWGVDGIISDHPDRVIEALRSAAVRSDSDS